MLHGLVLLSVAEDAGVLGLEVYRVLVVNGVGGFLAFEGACAGEHRTFLGSLGHGHGACAVVVAVPDGVDGVDEMCARSASENEETRYVLCLHQ